MNTATMHPTSQMRHSHHQPVFFARCENWLDARGKGAWIAAMIIGFVFFWPIGLALLAYMTWSKKMFRKSCESTRHIHTAMTSSGNRAFDAYKAETLRRLEDEQTNFEAFLARLRDAKDKAEFDQFMDDRASSAPETEDTEAKA
jgi:predicted negative regulator of RcsB-dependent stress response